MNESENSEPRIKNESMKFFSKCILPTRLIEERLDVGLLDTQNQFLD